MRVRLWLRRILVTAAVFILVTAALTARFFVWPASSNPSSVDAVVVLSGDFGDRMARALKLMSAGTAPVLVHAGTPDSAFVLQVCAHNDQPFEVVCLHPRPDNTHWEARAVGNLVRRRHWHKIAVVTSTFHATRAGIEFRRCGGAHVAMVATKSRAGRHFALGQIPREWVRVLYLETAHRSC